MPERRRRHERAEPDAAGLAREAREGGPGIRRTRQRVGVAHREEVVGPEPAVEAEALGGGGLGELVVVARALLRLGEDAQLHGVRPRRRVVGEHVEHRIVQQPVRRERAAVPRARFARDRGEAAAGLLDDRHERRQVVGLHVELARDVDEALGEQRVRPQVAVGAVAPDLLRQGEQPVEVAGVAPLREALEAERGVGESLDAGHAQPASARYASGCRIRRVRGVGTELAGRCGRPGAEAAGGPPAAAHRGGGGDADHGHAVDRERDERAPHRHAAQEVRGAVDRVDDPLPRGVALGAELLAEDPVAGARLGEPVADGALHRQIGLGDGRAVGLRLHVEVDRAEAGERDGVGEVGEFEGEIEVFGVVVGHLIRLSATSVGRARRPPGRVIRSIGAPAGSPDNVVPRFGLSKIAGPSTRTACTSSSIGRATDS